MRPGQDAGEGVGHVGHVPGQDHDVVCVTECGDNCGRHADT